MRMLFDATLSYLQLHFIAQANTIRSWITFLNFYRQHYMHDITNRLCSFAQLYIHFHLNESESRMQTHRMLYDMSHYC